MPLYSSEIHSKESLGTELGVIQDSGDTLIVGSLGRAVVYDSLFHDAEYEYRNRGEEPLKHGVFSRDIDVIGIDPATAGRAGPFRVDAKVFDYPIVRIVKQDDAWWLLSPRRNFAEPLHPAIMEPVLGNTVYGINCRTVPLRTHLELYGLKGRLRHKDSRTRELLVHASESGGYDVLPDDLYGPFSALRALNNKGVRSPKVQLVYYTLSSPLRN
jgi:hypothetical protein